VKEERTYEGPGSELCERQHENQNIRYVVHIKF